MSSAVPTDECLLCGRGSVDSVDVGRSFLVICDNCGFSVEVWK